MSGGRVVGGPSTPGCVIGCLVIESAVLVGVIVGLLITLAVWAEGSRDRKMTILRGDGVAVRSTAPAYAGNLWESAARNWCAVALLGVSALGFVMTSIRMLWRRR